MRGSADVAVQHDKAVVNAKYEGMSPLYLSLCQGFTIYMKILIANGANVNDVDTHGTPMVAVPLLRKCEPYLRSRLIDALIDAGAVLSAPVLHRAVRHAAWDACEHLLSRRCDPNAVVDGTTALQLAIERNSRRHGSLLLQYRAVPTAKEIALATERGRQDLLRLITVLSFHFGR